MKLRNMKTKFTFAALITWLLLVAPPFAFSQNNKGGKHHENAPQGIQASIDKVIPNLDHHNIAVVFANLDPNEEYHIQLLNANREVINNYWIDDTSLTLYVGTILSGSYELVLLKGKEPIDRKQVLLQ